jgi:succinyl-CoA synthetase beta subunit
MKIHEYQAKELLRKFHVPVPEGAVANTNLEARQVAEELAEGPFVVKAQIHAGGRGKGGGIKIGATPEEVERLADQILGMTLITPDRSRRKVVSRSWWSRPGDRQELTWGSSSTAA